MFSVKKNMGKPNKLALCSVDYDKPKRLRKEKGFVYIEVRFGEQIEFFQEIK